MGGNLWSNAKLAAGPVNELTLLPRQFSNDTVG